MGIAVACLLAIHVLASAGCSSVRPFRAGRPSLQHVGVFPERLVDSSDTPSVINQNEADRGFARGCIRKVFAEDGVANVETTLRSRRIEAFLVSKNRSLLYEYYGPEHDSHTKFPLFSITKSLVGLLWAVAQERGTVENLEVLVASLLPVGVAMEAVDGVTVRQLLDMKSGIRFDEEYESPFSDVARLYYGARISESLKRLESERTPGLEFAYKSIDTQTLGLALEQATGQTLDALLEAWIWRPAGMADTASWATDDGGTIKAFCCLAATPRDMLRLGHLLLAEEVRDENQVIPRKWIREISSWPERSDTDEYHRHFWLGVEDERDYFALGLLGQYLYVNPRRDVVVVVHGDKSDLLSLDSRQLSILLDEPGGCPVD